MSNKTIGPKSDPTLNYLLGDVQRQTALAINCVQIGTIEDYNATNNTVKVSLNFKAVMKNGDEVSYPVLEDCPVFVISGGDSSLSMPITAGDTCIVLFNDKNIDDWYLTGKVKAPADNRIHSIADGIVLVGIRSLADLKAYPSIPALDGGSKKIAIKNNDTDLKTLLTDLNNTFKDTIDTVTSMNDEITGLIDAIKAIATVGSATAQTVSPASQETFDPIAALFDGFKTELEGYSSDVTTLITEVAKLLDEGDII